MLISTLQLWHDLLCITYHRFARIWMRIQKAFILLRVVQESKSNFFSRCQLLQQYNQDKGYTGGCGITVTLTLTAIVTLFLASALALVVAESTLPKVHYIYQVLRGLFFHLFWAFHPILVTLFLVVFGKEVTKILRNSLFIFHFILPILPYKQKTYTENHET